MMLYRGGKRREREGERQQQKREQGGKKVTKTEGKYFPPTNGLCFLFSDTDVGMAVYTVYIDIVYCYYLEWMWVGLSRVGEGGVYQSRLIMVGLFLPPHYYYHECMLLLISRCYVPFDSII